MPPKRSPSSPTSTSPLSFSTSFFFFAVAPALLAVFLALFSSLTKPAFPVPTPEEHAIIITGSSTGIGRHAAESLAKAGYLVFAGIRKEGDVDDLVTAIQTHTHTHTHTSKGKVVPLLLDVCKGEMIEAAVVEVERILQEEGKKLGALVNNAGIGLSLPVEVLPLEGLRRVLETNVVGVVAVTQAFLPLLRRDTGRIINVGSAAGFTVPISYGAYSSSKFALEALTDALRMELSPWNIAVALLEPGTIQSEIRRRNMGENAPFHSLPPETYALYQGLFTNYESRAATLEAHAGPTQLTTTAITHAFTHTHPHTRYVVGSYMGMSLWGLKLFVLSWLPDHVQDWVKIQGTPGLLAASKKKE